MVDEPYLKALLRAIDEAKDECASRPPTADKPPEYQWGYLQGKFAGLKLAVQILERVEEEINQRERTRYHANRVA